MTKLITMLLFSLVLTKYKIPHLNLSRTLPLILHPDILAKKSIHIDLDPVVRCYFNIKH